MKAEDYAYGSCHKQLINLQASFDARPVDLNCITNVAILLFHYN